jgi:hypothetical protein
MEAIVAGLRGYQPRDETGALSPFAEFDWYERSDIQAARRRAQQEGVRAITARHLLLGFIDTPSRTRVQLNTSLGDDAFARLVRTAEAVAAPLATPGVEAIFERAPPATDDAE